MTTPSEEVFGDMSKPNTAPECGATNQLIDNGAPCRYLAGHLDAGILHTTANGLWWADEPAPVPAAPVSEGPHCSCCVVSPEFCDPTHNMHCPCGDPEDARHWMLVGIALADRPLWRAVDKAIGPFLPCSPKDHHPSCCPAVIGVMKELTGYVSPTQAAKDRADAGAGVANAFVQWAVVNEIAEPPLDWNWFGEIARRYSPLHEESES